MKWSDLSRYVLGVCLAVSAMVASAGEIVVVTSIRPLQWLVEALVPADTRVNSLLPSGRSAHDYALRPADVAAIRESDLLVWVGPAMEPWLVQLAHNLPKGRSLVLQPDAPAHEHSGKTEPHSLTADPHVWLDPTAMSRLAEDVAKKLQQLLPDQHDRIGARLQDFQLAMASLDKDLQTRFAPVKDIGFVVYHDSYAPLVRRYGLNQRAAVWRHEALTTGVRDRAALRALLQGGSVRCVFYEPEYGREAVAGWLSQEATGIKIAELDPLGGSSKGGQDAYSHMMQQLAETIGRCLEKS